MKTLLKAEIILLLACLLYCFAPLRCEAAEYRITEAELTRLETNLTQLEAINKQSQQESKMLRKQLAEAKKQLTMLTQQLNELKADSEKQQQLLQTANQSLEQYAQEEKAKQRNLKRQRNIAYIIAAGLLYAAVK
jgi:septal ring factor EnvC (AmiA/AmiB activator)